LPANDGLGRRLRHCLRCSGFARHSVALHVLFQDRDGIAALGTLEPDPFPGDLLVSDAEKFAARLATDIHDG
jgi:hypothetical protein